MATLEDFLPFKEDPKGWNRWAETHTDDKANLAHADLSNSQLPAINFSGAFLQETNFQNADLSRANFSGSNLSGADFTGAILVGADFTGAYLVDTIFNHCKMAEVRLVKVFAQNAQFNNTDLQGAKFDAGLFKSARFQSANLISSRFRRSDLQHATLTQSLISSAGFWGTNLSHASLDYTAGEGIKAYHCLLNATKAQHANWPNSYLCCNVLHGMDLRHATLQHSNLSDCDFSETDFRYADLSHARLDRSELNKVKLWGSQRSNWSIAGTSCRQAFWDELAQQDVLYADLDFQTSLMAFPSVDITFPASLNSICNALPRLNRHMSKWFEGVELELTGLRAGTEASTIVSVEIINDGGQSPLELSRIMIEHAQKWTPN